MLSSEWLDPRESARQAWLKHLRSAWDSFHQMKENRQASWMVLRLTMSKNYVLAACIACIVAFCSQPQPFEAFCIISNRGIYIQEITRMNRNWRLFYCIIIHLSYLMAYLGLPRSDNCQKLPTLCQVSLQQSSICMRAMVSQRGGTPGSIRDLFAKSYRFLGEDLEIKSLCVSKYHLVMTNIAMV